MKNFLKPERHTHKDPEVRVTSLESMDSSLSENQTLIENMACTDSEESVRVAAVNQCNSVGSLLRVLDAQPSLAKAIEARIAQLAADNAVSEADANTLIEKQPELYAPLLAATCASEAVRLSALKKITSESEFLTIIEQTRFHDVRLACAKNLKNDENIKAALSACRSRDKEVARFLQSSVDEKSALASEQKATTELVDSTHSAMQALGTSVWSPQTSGKFAALKSKWDSIGVSYRTELQTSFDDASSKVANVIEENEKKNAVAAVEENAAADKNAESAATAAQSATPATEAVATPNAVAPATKPVAPPVANVPDPARDALLSALATVKLEELDAFEYKESIEKGSESEKVLAHAKSVGVLFNPPFDLTKARPGAITERSKRVASLLDTNATLPGVAIAKCAYMTGLREHADVLTNRLDKAKQESIDRAKATHKQFASLSAKITEGQWGPASSMFRRLNKKVDGMEPSERGQFSDKLSRAEKQLAEMADWQDFAARPKLEALCDEMEALPAKELAPEALAKEIKTHQAQWKSLGASRASNDLWARFKTAGDTAYEPCKAFFAEKQEQRDGKVAAKVELCDQLAEQTKAIDWDAADWKAVQRMVNNAKRDWSKNRVSDRKPDRALEQRFSDVLKPLDEKLATQYDANVLEKKDLIEKIQKLAEAEINQHSANQAKKLQSAWKQVGIVRRKDDQALWEEFNSHCKVIYKHQHEAQREKYKASMSHVFRARDIIKELRKISKSSDSEEQQVQALQTEFQGLADFPDKDKKFLLRDFRGALDACSKIQENATKRRAQAEASEVVRLVELCEQLELAVESPDGASATMRDDVTHAWQNSEASVAREILSKLEARRDAAIKHLDAGTQYDYASNETERRQLLIRMEILADKETPAEDKGLRMQYQLENLSKGMTSSAVVDKRSELSQLVNEWHATAPVKQAVKDSLQSRFLAAAKK